MKIYRLFFSLLITSLFLSSCGMPVWQDNCCGGCHGLLRKGHQSQFAFVPFYEEEDLTQGKVGDYDVKEEQLYKQAPKTTNAFRNVTFATDSYTIKGENNLAILQSLVQYLKKNSKTTLFIEGHTDERGAAAYNLSLGSRRANAVKEYLIKQGVPANRLLTVSYGKEHPVHPGHNELAWQQNRRAEFKIHVG
ncbi:OmpA family protein [Chlamydiifrater phoenicopteri]|uniref:OmpA family protein n=1 Tax=Chlamydiifrater phoenicopteri TaxID=2681469 RepID=UPI001BD05F2B|nr:OmpA family protein [Chlamydiifrater phoenicopteri]